MVARNHSKKECRLCQHHLPTKKSYGATISTLCSLKPSLLPHPARAKPQALSKNCIVLAAWGRCEVFCATTLDYSILLIWTIGNPRPRRSRSMGTSISIDPLSSMENSPRSIFRRSIPMESVVHVHGYPTLVATLLGVHWP